MKNRLLIFFALFLLALFGAVSEGYCEKQELLPGICYIDTTPESIREIYDETGYRIRTAFEDLVFVDFYFKKSVMKKGKLDLTRDNPPLKIFISSFSSPEIKIFDKKNVSFELFDDGAKQFAALYEGDCTVSLDRANTVVVSLIQETKEKKDSASYFVEKNTRPFLVN